MRGQHSLFSEHFEVVTERKQETPRPRNYFMPERDQHLAYRYYYYAEIKYMRYDKCLEFLEKEFYLTKARIIVVLTNSNDHIRSIVEAKPTVKDLKEKVPHFSW